MFGVENGAGGMYHKAEMIAMAERINLRAIALLSDKGIVARNAAVVVQAKNLAIRAHGILRFLNFACRGRGDQNRPIQREGQTRTAYIGPLLRAVKLLDLGE